MALHRVNSNILVKFPVWGVKTSAVMIMNDLDKYETEWPYARSLILFRPGVFATSETGSLIISHHPHPTKKQKRPNQFESIQFHVREKPRKHWPIFLKLHSISILGSLSRTYSFLQFYYLRKLAVGAVVNKTKLSFMSSKMSFCSITFGRTRESGYGRQPHRKVFF